MAFAFHGENPPTSNSISNDYETARGEFIEWYGDVTKDDHEGVLFDIASVICFIPEGSEFVVVENDFCLNPEMYVEREDDYGYPIHGLGAEGFTAEYSDAYFKDIEQVVGFDPLEHMERVWMVEEDNYPVVFEGDGYDVALAPRLRD